MIQFDEHIFQLGWFNHQPDKCVYLSKESFMIKPVGYWVIQICRWLVCIENWWLNLWHMKIRILHFFLKGWFALPRVCWLMKRVMRVHRKKIWHSTLLILQERWILHFWFKRIWTCDAFDRHEHHEQWCCGSLEMLVVDACCQIGVVVVWSNCSPIAMGSFWHWSKWIENSSIHLDHPPGSWMMNSMNPPGGFSCHKMCPECTESLGCFFS